MRQFVKVCAIIFFDLPVYVSSPLSLSCGHCLKSLSQEHRAVGVRVDIGIDLRVQPGADRHTGGRIMADPISRCEGCCNVTLDPGGLWLQRT